MNGGNGVGSGASPAGTAGATVDNFFSGALPGGFALAAGGSAPPAVGGRGASSSGGGGGGGGFLARWRMARKMCFTVACWANASGVSPNPRHQ